jgi:hypothetical protein
MLDVADRALSEIMRQIPKNESSPGQLGNSLVAVALSMVRASVSTHKERVYRIMRNFTQEREDAMYVDFRGEKWTLPPLLSPEMLAMDGILLIVVARAANAYLGEGLPFSLATEALLDLSQNVKSEQSQKFLSVLAERDPVWFGFFKKENT